MAAVPIPMVCCALSQPLPSLTTQCDVIHYQSDALKVQVLYIRTYVRTPLITGDKSTTADSYLRT